VDFVPRVFLASFIFFVALSVVSSVLPARRAARQNIVDALGTCEGRHLVGRESRYLQHRSDLTHQPLKRSAGRGGSVTPLPLQFFERLFRIIGPRELPSRLIALRSDATAFFWSPSPA